MSYKLDFKITNNIAEYEALLLGVKASKEMGIVHTVGEQYFSSKEWQA